MKEYDLTGARVEEPGGLPLMVVLVPWRYFCHPLGPDEYNSRISKAKWMPVAVSLAPDGKWHCHEPSAHHWARILANTPAEKLGWHTIKIQGDESPEDRMERWIRAGIR
jgi:hypothetical protein